MGTKLILVIAAIVVIALIFIGLGASSYNSLYAKREAIDAQWSQVETNLQRRSDLIPNLVSTVQASLTQEQEVFGRIAEARAGLTRAVTGGSREEVIAADNRLSSALGQLRVLVLNENYPQLRSNENIQRLMDELAGTENRLAVSRQDYNTVVQNYNTTRGQFPTVLVASLTGFQHEDAYYKAQPGAETAPKVDFN